MEIYKIENLNKAYGKNEAIVKAINNISFTITEGDFLAIMGPSGSGKTTLINMLAGLDFPTNGKIYFYGKNIQEMNNNELAMLRREKIGVIYQSYNLIPTLNVEENITLPIELNREKVDLKKLNSILKLLNIESRRKHLPNELSGGQQQKVAIGRALMIEPSVILADEPTGNLDVKSGNEVINLLEIANKKFNQTIILVTHNIEIAKQAKHIMRIEDGKIIN